MLSIEPIVKSHHVCDTPRGKLHGKFIYISGNIPYIIKENSGKLESQFQLDSLKNV